jgi:hypothetical protein
VVQLFAYGPMLLLELFNAIAKLDEKLFCGSQKLVLSSKQAIKTFWERPYKVLRAFLSLVKLHLGLPGIFSNTSTNCGHKSKQLGAILPQSAKRLVRGIPRMVVTGIPVSGQIFRMTHKHRARRCHSGGATHTFHKNSKISQRHLQERNRPTSKYHVTKGQFKKLN